MAIRYASLAACVATAVFLVVALWELFRAATPKALPMLVLAILSLATATMPVFYLALYRSETALVFPKGLRLAAGITAAAVTVEFMFLFSRLVLYRAPNSRVHAVMYVFFLRFVDGDLRVGFHRLRPWPRAEFAGRVPRFLAIATLVATVAGGAWVSYMAIGIGVGLFAHLARAAHASLCLHRRRRR